MNSAVEVVDAVEESGKYLSKPDEVHDWFTRGQGNWDVPI